MDSVLKENSVSAKVAMVVKVIESVAGLASNICKENEEANFRILGDIQ